MYSRTEDTIRVTARPSHLYARSVRCDVDARKYIAYTNGDCCKMLHLGDDSPSRTISKAAGEGLAVILSAKWGVSYGLVGTQHSRLACLMSHFTTALLVMTLTDAKGAEWIVAKYRENWVASRMSVKSRSTVVQIYT